MSLLGTTISDIKSAISKRAGLATPTRFTVYMQPPRSSLLNLDLAGIAQQLISNHSFDPMSLLNDPRDIGFLCTAVNLPGRQITTMDYAAHRQAQPVPTGTILEHVSMSFLVTNDYWIKKMFDTWTASVIDFNRYRAKYRSEYSSDVVIQQLDKNDIPVYGAKLIHAFPVTVTSIQMDSNAMNQVQLLTVVMAYDELENQGAIGSTLSAVGSALGPLGNFVNGGSLANVGSLLG